MMTLRRAGERHHDRRSSHDGWLTFYPRNRADPLADGFDGLELLDEYRLSPASSLPGRARLDSERLTYVCEGALTYQDSSGDSGVIQAGEFQRTSIARGVRYSNENASRTDSTRVLRVSLRPERVGLAPAQEQKRFSVAERRGGLRVVASPDARRGSLRLFHDVLIHSALLDPGQHVIHELAAGRSAWCYVLDGAVTLGGAVLTAGDGVGIRDERVVSLTAVDQTEVMLVDVPRDVRPASQ